MTVVVARRGRELATLRAPRTRSAAIFDLDGTLVRGTSAERLFVPYLARRGLLGPRQVGAALSRVATLPVVGRTRALRRNKRYLAGLPVEEVERAARDFVADELRGRWSAAALAELEARRSGGDLVLLLTGAPYFLAESVREGLELNGAIGTELEVEDGRFTGRIAGPHLFADAKVEALEALAARHRVDLRRSSGFADHGSDISFLERFAEPVAVDPDRALRRHAEERGWDIIRSG